MRLSFLFNDRFICLFVVMPMFLLSTIIHFRLYAIYKKFSDIFNSKGLTGAVVARNILDGAGLTNVRIECISGDLTDHFDPSANVVRLSAENYDSDSIAAVGVAAHEVGHAIQYALNYIPMRVRSKSVLLTQFGSYLYLPIFILGLIFAKVKLMWLGVILFSTIFFFELITLPVEFDASFRAIRILRNKQILDSEELVGVKKVLWAAAMTYVASFLMSAVQLLRFVLLTSSNSKRK